MTVSINGTSGIVNDATDLNYTGTLTGGTGVVNLGSGQVYKDASGNVGIGTTSPTEKLTVAGAISATSNAANFDQAKATFDYASGAGRIAAYASTGGSLQFFTNPNGGTVNERARIDSSGNLLVGGTSTIDGARLHVYASAANVAISTKPLSNVNYDGVTFRNFAGAYVGYISVTTTSTAYVTSSDYRLKEAIAPMTGALAKVAALKPVTYKWKSNGVATQGFIAHELQAVVPECVTGEKDAVDADGNPQYQGIDTSFLIATLSAAIQELHALVKTQAARITALEGTA